MFLTHQCVYVEARLRLPASIFRNQLGNQQIVMLVRMCPFSNQLIPLPLNDDTAASGGNGMKISESEVSPVSGALGIVVKERMVCLQMRRKKVSQIPFFFFY